MTGVQTCALPISGGTPGHAALLLIAKLRDDTARPVGRERIVSANRELAETHRRRWAEDLVDSPERLASRVTELPLDLRLVLSACPLRLGEDSRAVREICGNRLCSVVLRRANRNAASLGKLLNVEPILSGAAGSYAGVEGSSPSLSTTL